MNYELPSDTEIGDSMGPLEESSASKKGFLMFSKVKAGKEVSDKKAEDNEFELNERQNLEREINVNDVEKEQTSPKSPYNNIKGNEPNIYLK